MTAMQNFRSAFNGFNREDVVRYIEYINSRHTTEVNQLKSELDLLQNRMERVPDVEALAAEIARVRAQRDQLLEMVSQLEEQVAQLEEQVAAPAPVEAAAPASAFSAEQELEAYRRAERMERVARERAEQVYHQANAALADATVKVDAAALEISRMSDAVLTQLNGLQAAVNSSKQALTEASETMYTIRPTQD